MKYRFRWFQLFIACSIWLASQAICAQQPQELDKIVAIVGNDVVLASELQFRIKQVEQRLQANKQPLPAYKIIYPQVLNHLIDERLQLNLAQNIGIKIKPAEINQAFEQLAKQNHLTVDQYRQKLTSQNIPVAKVRQQITQELILARVQQYYIDKRMHITDSEVNNLITSKAGQFLQQSDYYFGVIVLPLDVTQKNASPVLAQAQNIIKKLDQGDNFRDLAIRYSKGSTALKGGDIGWRKSIQLPTEIATVLNELQVGEYSRPIRSGGGIHIFKLYDKRTNDEQWMVEQNKVRHILIPTNTIRSDRDAYQLAQSLSDRIRNGEDFIELAKQYSEDYSNRSQGGDLGWVLPGQMVPEFEQAVTQAKINEISNPVRSKYGWHIILVEENQEVDKSDEVLHNQIVNWLRNRRYNEELQLWLQELKNNTFIKIIDNNVASTQDNVRIHTSSH